MQGRKERQKAKVICVGRFEPKNTFANNLRLCYRFSKERRPIAEIFLVDIFFNFTFLNIPSRSEIFFNFEKRPSFMGIPVHHMQYHLIYLIHTYTHLCKKLFDKTPQFNTRPFLRRAIQEHTLIVF